MARACDEAGFEAIAVSDHMIAVSDHMIHPEQLETPYPYTEDGRPRWDNFTDWPDPFVAIAAMAAVTERLRFITSVLVLPMWNPFQVAKTVATAAVMSNDRVVLGVGAGWMRDEFVAMEQPFESRGRRMDEMLEVIVDEFTGRLMPGRRFSDGLHQALDDRAADRGGAPSSGRRGRACQ